ncbi:MAG: amino acid ABC transporter ATP-binding protein [Clostridiales bacterium]|jgi:L-cystine transport system ATP-binding protein|nr:amino acid ABC transporter ATP-binding protein [Clostridiales bacterium]
MIAVHGIHKSFGKKKVLKGIDLEIEDGEVVVIIGSSGSGKTTFLRCVNFLERADEGEITIDDKTLNFHHSSRHEILMMRRKTAMVFQSYNLFKNMTVIKNIEAGLHIIQKKSREESKALAIAALEKVGLGDRAQSYPGELSGGQQQRVGIARAMALEPQIILFDEPTSALDPELIGEVLAVIKQLADEGQTMLIVSHEMNFVRKIANRVVFIDDGVVVEQGSPDEVFLRTQEERTKQFLKTVFEDWTYTI